MIPLVYLAGGLWVFAVGTVVGSFVNVCVYRLAWQKSVIWPASHCPRCLSQIVARDNIPILSWLWLRGRCRTCKLPIAARYPLVETLVGVLFVAVYYTDVVHSFGMLDLSQFARMGYHAILVAFLVTASLIDIDYYVIPDEVTINGILIALILGAIDPTIRSDPASAASLGQGIWIGVKGMLVGAGVILAVRVFGQLIFRREAMGMGDVTLMGMIGAFLGWEVILPTLFLASLLGLLPSLVKVLKIIWRWLSRRKSSSKESEIFFGPYLSLAALILMLVWPWFWPLLRRYHQTIGEVVRYLVWNEF